MAKQKSKNPMLSCPGLKDLNHTKTLNCSSHVHAENAVVDSSDDNEEEEDEEPIPQPNRKRRRGTNSTKQFVEENLSAPHPKQCRPPEGGVHPPKSLTWIPGHYMPSESAEVPAMWSTRPSSYAPE